jgi:hypothetical protein
MNLLNTSAALTSKFKVLPTLLILASTFVWSSHICSNRANLVPLRESGRIHPTSFAIGTLKSVRLSLSEDCVATSRIFMEPFLLNPEEDWDAFHASLPMRGQAGLIPFQSELRNTLPLYQFYQAPKLYLCLRSFLC